MVIRLLANIKEVVKESAIFHFNINNLEWTRYILEEHNKLNKPVILGVSESAIKYMGGYKTVYNIVTSLIDDLNINVPVCLHLDHGSSFESCKQALDAGFKSVMIDASNFPLEKNIEITKKVVHYAKKYNATVEGEIGCVGNNNQTIKYVNTLEAIEYVNKTNIDALAPAVGTIHGLFKNEPQIDYEKIIELKNKLNIPLVLHGATGLDDKTLIKCIKSGISKININTQLQVAWSNAVRNYLKNNKEIYDPRKIISSGENAIKEIIRNKLEILEVAKID